MNDLAQIALEKSRSAFELAQKGRHEEALKLFDEAIKVALKVSGVYKPLDTIAEVIIYMAKAGFYKEALEASRSFKSKNSKILALGLISRELALKGIDDEARKILHEAIITYNVSDKDYLDDYAIGEITRKFIEVKLEHYILDEVYYIDTSNARSIVFYEISSAIALENLNRALNLVKNIEDSVLKNKAMENIIISLINGKKFDEALKLIPEVKDVERVNALTHFVNSLIKSEMGDELIENLDKLIKLASSKYIRDTGSRQRIVCNISIGLAEQGHILKSFETLTHIRGFGLKLCIRRLIKIIMKKYDMNNIVHNINLLNNRGVKIKLVYEIMSNIFSNKRDFNSALEFCKKISDKHVKMLCIAEYMYILSEHGHVNEAKKLLYEYLDVFLKLVKTRYEYSYCIGSVLAKMIEAGMEEEALRIISVFRQRKRHKDIVEKLIYDLFGGLR